MWPGRGLNHRPLDLQTGSRLRLAAFGIKEEGHLLLNYLLRHLSSSISQTTLLECKLVRNLCILATTLAFISSQNPHIFGGL